MDIDEIEKLVDLVNRSGVSQVTLRNGDRRLTIRKGRTVARSTALVPIPPAETVEAPLAEATNGTADHAAQRWITAPMVGIFFHAEPPVAPGAHVERGTVVGVIESMKLMNDVRAEFGGMVTDISVEAGMAVEYGQHLFALAESPNGASHE